MLNYKFNNVSSGICNSTQRAVHIYTKNPAELNQRGFYYLRIQKD